MLTKLLQLLVETLRARNGVCPGSDAMGKCDEVPKRNDHFLKNCMVRDIRLVCKGLQVEGKGLLIVGMELRTWQLHSVEKDIPVADDHAAFH